MEEKLKAGRVKRPEGSKFSEEHHKKRAGTPGHLTKKDLTQHILVDIDF